MKTVILMASLIFGSTGEVATNVGPVVMESSAQCLEKVEGLKKVAEMQGMDLVASCKVLHDPEDHLRYLKQLKQQHR